MPETPKLLVALVTCPPTQAAALANALVHARVAACVNIIPAVESVYRWKSAVQHDSEALLLIKTTADSFEALKRAVLKHHPYELPEVIAVPVELGHRPYLDWVVESLK